ncbi:MAG: peptide chain release factor 1 [Patescibacteria group bacterium]|nr:peptide chain release factor 1 [Patescibacteria group bacterium]
MEEKIKQFKKRLAELEKELQNPDLGSDPVKFKKISTEYNELKENVEIFDALENANQDLQDSKDIIDNEKDHEIIKMAEEDKQKAEKTISDLEEKVKIALIPNDPNDSKDVIMEIRAGAGGDEAALFAADLFRMYSQYAEKKGWTINIMNSNRIGIGGFKEIIFEVSGANVYADLKYESGVHRVQRIPDTEKSGRVHTSTVTVAVLPEAEEVDFEIKPEDLRIDVFRSGGHGGQSVNTTDSAVRITYLPTGMIVTCQDEKSQHKNKAKAMTVLRSRLIQEQQEKEMKENSDARKSQIGTGDRSEKIRTYNYPQDRITDHRIKQNWSSIENIINGDLNPVINALRTEDQKRKLAE